MTSASGVWLKSSSFKCSRPQKVSSCNSTLNGFLFNPSFFNLLKLWKSPGCRDFSMFIFRNKSSKFVKQSKIPLSKSSSILTSKLRVCNEVSRPLNASELIFFRPKSTKHSHISLLKQEKGSDSTMFILKLNKPKNSRLWRQFWNSLNVSAFKFPRKKFACWSPFFITSRCVFKFLSGSRISARLYESWRASGWAREKLRSTEKFGFVWISWKTLTWWTISSTLTRELVLIPKRKMSLKRNWASGLTELILTSPIFKWTIWNSESFFIWMTRSLLRVSRKEILIEGFVSFSFSIKNFKTHKTKKR